MNVHRRRGACTGALVLVMAVGATGAAQEMPSLREGARVRLLARDLYPEPLIGTVVEIDDETLSLRLGDRETPALVPREAITRLEVSAGRKSRGRGALFGAVIGGLVGAIALAATPEPSCGPNPWSCIGVSKGEAAPAVIGLGAGVGALVGLAITPGEKWTVVPSARVAISPAHRRHVQVSLTVAF